jgi:hypothetical protein
MKTLYVVGIAVGATAAVTGLGFYAYQRSMRAREGVRAVEKQQENARALTEEQRKRPSIIAPVITDPSFALTRANARESVGDESRERIEDTPTPDRPSGTRLLFFETDSGVVSRTPSGANYTQQAETIVAGVRADPARASRPVREEYETDSEQTSTRRRDESTGSASDPHYSSARNYIRRLVS